MKCRYSYRKVIHRIGLNPILRIGLELDFKDEFEQDYLLMILNPKYKIELYEVTKDLGSREPRGLVDHVVGGEHPPTPSHF